MAVYNIILLTIVSSFIAYGHTAPKVLNDEFALAQLEGEWLDIGRISTCNDIPLHPCITHTIEAITDGTHKYLLSSDPYESIPNCDRGVPIYTGAVFVKFVDARIFSRGSTYYSGLNDTIKSYNDGKELIFTEAQRESTSGTSYRLWSRKREVSAETIAEFEKLAGNRTVEYSPWDHCPIVRSEIHEAPVNLVRDGLWYDIARIASSGDNKSCCSSNMIVNHANNNIDIVDTFIENGKPHVKVSRGHLSEFGTVIRFRIHAEGWPNFYEISCNEGEHRITVEIGTTYIHLSSRNPRFLPENLAGFRKMIDMMKKTYPELVYTTYSYDNCAKWHD